MILHRKLIVLSNFSCRMEIVGEGFMFPGVGLQGVGEGFVLLGGGLLGLVGSFGSHG